MQMYSPRQGSRTLPWAKCQIFLEVLSICNNNNTNLNENFPKDIWPKAGSSIPALGQVSNFLKRFLYVTILIQI